MPTNPLTRTGTGIATGIAGLLAGVGLNIAPPVFVDGQLPANAPDGGCRTIKTGVLQGQSYCDLSAWATADENGGREWKCTTVLADGGCALMEFVSSASADAGVLVQAASRDGGK